MAYWFIMEVELLRCSLCIYRYSKYGLIINCLAEIYFPVMLTEYAEEVV